MERVEDDREPRSAPGQSTVVSTAQRGVALEERAVLPLRARAAYTRPRTGARRRAGPHAGPEGNDLVQAVEAEGGQQPVVVAELGHGGRNDVLTVNGEPCIGRDGSRSAFRQHSEADQTGEAVGEDPTREACSTRMPNANGIRWEREAEDLYPSGAVPAEDHL